MDLLDLRPIQTGAPDDEAPERPARYDHEVAADNRQNYASKRGRVCKYPECETKLRYSRKGSFCSRHDQTIVALTYGRASRPGRRTFKLPGLREARIKSGLTPQELGERMGRSSDWIFRIQRGAIGVREEVLHQIAGLVGASAASLVEGEFVKRGSGQPRKGSK